MFQTAHGVLFSLLVKLDEFPGGFADVVVADLRDEKRPIASVMEADVFDLHDRLGSWIAEFSEYKEQFEDGLERIPPGYRGGRPPEPDAQ